MRLIITNLDRLRVPKRKCKNCSKYSDREKMFIRGVMAFCDVDCAAQWGFKNKEKGANKLRSERKSSDTKRKKELMSRTEWYSKLQKLVNQYVKIRDINEPCCTCGTTNPNIKYDAGHFIAVKRGGVDPRRFELTNIHKQCSVNCNQHGSGMRAEYAEFIKNKYGQEHLDWLKRATNHKPLREVFPHWSDIENEIKKYRTKIRGLGYSPCV